MSEDEIPFTTWSCVTFIRNLYFNLKEGEALFNLFPSKATMKLIVVWNLTKMKGIMLPKEISAKWLVFKRHHKPRYVYFKHEHVLQFKSSNWSFYHGLRLNVGRAFTFKCVGTLSYHYINFRGKIVELQRQKQRNQMYMGRLLPSAFPHNSQPT